MQSKSRLGHHSLAGIDSGSTAPRLRRAALLRLLAVVGILGAGAVLPTAAAGEPGAIPFVQVRIDQVTPQVATTTSEPIVTVTGTVANIGDRPVRDVMVRLEHAPAVSNSAGLRTNLDGGPDQYQAAEEFVTLSPGLRPGPAGPRPVPAAGGGRPGRSTRHVRRHAERRRTRYLQTRTGHHAVAAGRPAQVGARRAGRDHTRPADGR